MTQEQKANAYDEAVRIAKDIYNCSSTDFDVKEHLGCIFPELKGRSDERIRNLLVEFFTNATQHKRNMGVGVSNEEILAWLEKQKESDEEGDFTIYHPLKNGRGEYECIPYSFFGSLTSFSKDKDLIDFLRTCFYTEKECKEWIEKQCERKPLSHNYDEAFDEFMSHIPEKDPEYSTSLYTYEDMVSAIEFGKKWAEKQKEQNEFPEVKTAEEDFEATSKE